MRIATLGPKGTYSETAARIYAKRNNISDVELEFVTVSTGLHRVQRREVDVAVFPFENAVDGLIGSTLDALIDCHDFVKVCDEVNVPIGHVLAGFPQVQVSELKVIYSHTSALNQCARRLEELVPNAQLVSTSSTAEAARLVKLNGDQYSAAICSESAVLDNELTVIERNIQDYETNTTKFVVCALTDSPRTGNDRTMVAIRPGEDRPGLLYSILGELARNNVNLTYIQSRPYKVRPKEYIFAFETEGHKIDVNVEAALFGLDRLVKETNGWKKILGSYPRREIGI